MARRDWPDNYLPMGENGYGIWNVWYDYGPGTPAFPFRNRNHEVIDFLCDDEAAAFARRKAEEDPEKRFAVKLKKATP